MAAIQPDQIVEVFDDGVNGKTALFVLKNVTTGNTADLSAHVYFGTVDFDGLFDTDCVDRGPGDGQPLKPP